MAIYVLDEGYTGSGTTVDGHPWLTSNGGNYKLHFEELGSPSAPNPPVVATIDAIAGGDADSDTYWSAGDTFEYSINGGPTLTGTVGYVYDPNGASDAQLMVFQDSVSGVWYAYNLGFTNPDDNRYDPSDPAKVPGGEIASGHARNGGLDPLADDYPSYYCFLSGTKIDTPEGSSIVEALKVGDSVKTISNGVQEIRWIGKTSVRATGVNKHLSPIRIKTGALGENTPSQDLLVSPAHRMLVSGWRSELLFGEAEALVAAKDLVNDDSITVAADLEEFEYFHILFDNHEIVVSNGAPSESFQLNAEVLGAMEQAVRDEVLELFPELENAPHSGKPARPVISGAEATLLH